MRLAIIGAGGIGSAFAWRFAESGHAVTLIARGARLEELKTKGLRVAKLREPVQVTLAPTLPEDEAYDLVLVTVLSTQVEPLLPALKRSKARAVMFMFNTFGGLDALREAVGTERFCFGFPAIIAKVEGGELTAKVVPRIFRLFQITWVGYARATEWRALFESAGIPCAVHDDLEAWLESHAAFFAPLMLAGVHGMPLTWPHARALATTMKAGFALVPHVTPLPVRVLSWSPRFFLTGMLWLLSRTPIAKALGGRGPNEARALLQQMNLELPATG